MLNHKEEDAEELEQTAQYHKNVEDRVHIADLLPQAKEDSAQCIGDTTGKNPKQTGQGNGGDRHLCGKNDTPTHADIADH